MFPWFIRVKAYKALQECTWNITKSYKNFTRAPTIVAEMTAETFYRRKSRPTLRVCIKWIKIQDGRYELKIIKTEFASQPLLFAPEEYES